MIKSEAKDDARDAQRQIRLANKQNLDDDAENDA